jgi:hypothetical protein
VAKKKKKKRIPQSSEAKAARQALIMADLIGWESDRARLASLTKGAYTGSPSLRSGGSVIGSRYRVGKPRADKGYRGYYGLGNRDRRKEKPIGRTKPGTGARLIKRSGGGRRTLKLWRRLGYRDRQRLLARARSGGNLTKLTRQRFRR